MTPLEKDLAEVLNKHSADNDAETPDYILAVYLVSCLKAFKRAVIWRESVTGPRLENGPRVIKREPGQ